MLTKVYSIHCLTPLHVGAGRGVGFIDLPIAREKSTNWPLVPGSAVKGVLADKHGADDQGREKDPKLAAAFGRAGDDSGNSGSLVFADARIVCLPVRSFYGTWAWATCPSVLRRLARDLKDAGLPEPPKVPECPNDDAALLASGAAAVAADMKVYLEDIDLVGRADPNAAAWAARLAPWATGWEQGVFAERFVVLSDNTFNFFSETGTDVAARVRIDDQKKSVASGALWYEESLPAEAILSGIVWCDGVYGKATDKPTAGELMESYASGCARLQMGGKATTGKGLVNVVFAEGK